MVQNALQVLKSNEIVWKHLPKGVRETVTDILYRDIDRCTVARLRLVSREFRDSLKHVASALVDFNDMYDVMMYSCSQEVALETVKWAVEVCKSNSSNSLNLLNSRKKNRGMLKKNGPKVSDAAMRAACERGFLKMVEFLHQNDMIPSRYASYIVPPMAAAAESGNLELVLLLQRLREEEQRKVNAEPDENKRKQMLSNRKIWAFTCNENATDSAASLGHLEMVKWLLEDDGAWGEPLDVSYRCSGSAEVWAAEGGHLEVLKYLHEKGICSCTDEAYSAATQYGQHHIVEYLDQFLEVS